jgi:hypothetical protein
MPTIAEIERTLPNGLHDAILKRYVVDYELASAELSFDVWVGDLNSDKDSTREAYRSGKLTLLGLDYLVVEPPDLSVASKPGPFACSVSATDEVNPQVKLPNGVENGFRESFFLYSTNSFIHICAKNAEFTYDT